MIKLTDQQIRDAVNGAGLTFTHPDLTVGRAVEAEVLRLNGITEMTREQKRAFTQDMIADMNGEIEG